MERTIIKHLNYAYYGMMCLAIAAAALCYWLVMHNMVTPIDPQSQLGAALQYIVIADLLLTLPGGLYWHKRVCTRLATEQDETTRLLAYQRSALRRILLVSNTMVLGVAAFYLMGAYQSMIWVAAIAAIGWYFTKPTERKLFLELQPEQY